MDLETRVWGLLTLSLSFSVLGTGKLFSHVVEINLCLRHSNYYLSLIMPSWRPDSTPGLFPQLLKSHQCTRKFTLSVWLLVGGGGVQRNEREDVHYLFHQEQLQPVKERTADQTAYNVLLILY